MAPKAPRHQVETDEWRKRRHLGRTNACKINILNVVGIMSLIDDYVKKNNIDKVKLMLAAGKGPLAYSYVIKNARPLDVYDLAVALGFAVIPMSLTFPADGQELAFEHSCMCSATIIVKGRPKVCKLHQINMHNVRTAYSWSCLGRRGKLFHNSVADALNHAMGRGKINIVNVRCGAAASIQYERWSELLVIDEI